jgi:hypothetical protein
MAVPRRAGVAREAGRTPLNDKPRLGSTMEEKARACAALQCPPVRPSSASVQLGEVRTAIRWYPDQQCEGTGEKDTTVGTGQIPRLGEAPMHKARGWQGAGGRGQACASGKVHATQPSWARVRIRTVPWFAAPKGHRTSPMQYR